jgi:hypothetical protein
MNISNQHRCWTAALGPDLATQTGGDHGLDAETLPPGVLTSVAAGSIVGQAANGAQLGGVVGALTLNPVAAAAGAGIGATIWGAAAMGYEFAKHGKDVTKWDWSS